MKRTTITLLLAMAAFTSCKFISLEDFETPEYYGDFTWTKVVENASWSNRFDHAAVSYQNKLWVIGGYNPGQVKGDPYLEDVWSSADGKTWELVQADAPWKGRRGHTVTVFDDGTGEAMFLAEGSRWMKPPATGNITTMYGSRPMVRTGSSSGIIVIGSRG